MSRKRPPEVEPLERDELTALLTKVTATMDADDALRVLILARTGTRPGEVAALRVGDVDLRKAFAVVRRSYDDNHGVGTPKSGKTRRVDLSPHVVAAIKTHIAGRAVVDLDPIARREAWLFPSKDNPSAPARVDPFRRRVNEVARAVGIARFNLKLFRHTYASHLLVHENAPIHYVQAQLGHHSPDFHAARLRPPAVARSGTLRGSTRRGGGHRGVRRRARRDGVELTPVDHSSPLRSSSGKKKLLRRSCPSVGVAKRSPTLRRVCAG